MLYGVSLRYKESANVSELYRKLGLSSECWEFDFTYPPDLHCCGFGSVAWRL